MGPGEIIIYVVIALALAGILWVALRPRKQLPAEETKKPLAEAEDEEAPAEEEEAPAEAEDEAPAEAEEEAPADEEEAPADEEAAEAEEKPEEGEAPAEAEEKPPAEEEKPEGPKVPRFAPPPTFAPPPSIKAPKVTPPKVDVPKVDVPKVEPKKEAPEPKQEAPEAKQEAPEPEAKKEAAEPEPLESEQPTEPVQVPMPVEKPKVPTREEREKATLEARKSERDRYRKGLKKTKRGFIAKLARLFKGKPKVSDDLKDDIEEVLFTADIGARTAEALLATVTEELDKKEVADPDAVWEVIRAKALELLDIEAEELNYAPELGPYTLLMIGVNGVGKTTTLGKLAARHVEAGRKTLLVAGDTFRAAAGEQLEVWARRVGCDIHMGKEGADPSSVIFDGIMRGRKEDYDVVLCDTAGRLHTRKELMDELGKMGRSAAKALSKDRDAVEPHDVFLVLDATIGQNALAQAQLFKETMKFSGLVLTKLDGTAKGGVVLGVVDELKIPIRYIGIGEGVDDLRRFDPEAFCDVLFEPDANKSDDDDDDDGEDDADDA